MQNVMGVASEMEVDSKEKAPDDLELVDGAELGDVKLIGGSPGKLRRGVLHKKDPRAFSAAVRCLGVTPAPRAMTVIHSRDEAIGS